MGPLFGPRGSGRSGLLGDRGPAAILSLDTMTNQTKQLLAEVLKLPLPERAAFAAEVLASIDGEAEPNADAAWLAEIERRARRVMSGESEGIPLEDVAARIEERLRGSA